MTKLRNQELNTFYNSFKNKQTNKKPRSIPNQGSERPLQGKLQNTAERNHRQYKQMETHPMLMNGRINIVKMTILPKAIC